MLLDIQNINLRIGGLQILRDVNLEIEKGEITSIIGPNGAGKSTLFNVITGRISPNTGNVWFKEKKITNLLPFEIARMGISRSFQLTNIFAGLSVLDNVCIAAQTISPFRSSLVSQISRDLDTLQKAEDILELIGLKAIKNKYAYELSHGDQRRLEMGMSLATEPDLLMLDEPTSGMSPTETEATIDLVKSLSKRVTICIIEHKMSLVMGLSKKIVVLNFGKKIFEGSPEEIASNDEVQKIYLGTA